jgi:hypothetical protein
MPQVVVNMNIISFINIDSELKVNSTKLRHAPYSHPQTITIPLKNIIIFRKQIPPSFLKKTPYTSLKIANNTFFYTQ